MYYSAADMLAAPSVYESFGMAALEAMACRIPVLAFRVGGLAALVRHDWNGLLATPGDYHDFTAKLHTALTAADLGRMGRRARLTAQQFSWDMVTERTLALYDRLVRARYPLYRPASAAR